MPVEEEVVRLRGEVDTLRSEVQRLLRLNAELQHQQHDAATNNRPEPPSKISISGGAVAVPPPPPPPLPRHQNQRVPSAPVSKATALVDMYNSLQTSNKKPSKHTDKSRSHHQHSSIVDELQNRSRHLLASDETAVLKHFNWPERKADALHEAASEYRHLKCLLTEISSLRDGDDGGNEATTTLRKISSLLDKLEKSMGRLVNLRRSVVPSYKEFRIPSDWMLDSGMASKMRLASVSLAKMYTKTVLKELDCRDTAETGNEAALVAQSVRFTYRVHQFAGGLDCEAMHAFEELRSRVQLVSQ